MADIQKDRSAGRQQIPDPRKRERSFAVVAQMPKNVPETDNDFERGSRNVNFGNAAWPDFHAVGAAGAHTRAGLQKDDPSHAGGAGDSQSAASIARPDIEQRAGRTDAIDNDLFDLLQITLFGFRPGPIGGRKNVIGRNGREHAPRRRHGTAQIAALLTGTSTESLTHQRAGIRASAAIFQPRK